LHNINALKFHVKYKFFKK